MKNWKVNRWDVIFNVSIVLIILFLFLGLSFLKEKYSLSNIVYYPLLGLLFMVVNIYIVVLVSLLGSRKNHVLIKPLVNIALFPSKILNWLEPIILRIFILIFGVIVPLFIILSFYYYTLFLLFRVNKTLILYLTFLTTSILTSNFITKILQLSISKTLKHQSVSVKAIYENYISKFTNEGVRFIIYLLYFVLLIANSFIVFNELEVDFDTSIFSAILYSFVTFIAFDRLQQNWHLFKEKKKQ